MTGDRLTRAATSDADWASAEPIEADRDGEPIDLEAATEAHVHAVQALSGARTLLDETLAPLVRALEAHGEREALLEELLWLRTQRKALADAEAYVEAHAVRLIRDQAVGGDYDGALADGTPYEYHSGAQRKAWDHDSLAREVVAGLIRDAGGEAPDPFTVRDALMECAAPSYWRVKALKARGIAADDYCERSPGRATISFTTTEGTTK